jgi:hypothetical protein
MSDELMERLKALRTRLHEEDSPGNVRVRWHPDGFTVDDAIEEIVRLRDALKGLLEATGQPEGSDSRRDAFVEAEAALKGNTQGKTDEVPG